MAWERIRREASYRVNCYYATKRMEKLNEVLAELQEQFEAGVQEGVLMELSPSQVNWINDVLEIEEGV